MPTHTTIATAARLVERTLQDYGCDVDALFREAGVQRSSLRDPDMRLPVGVTQKLWRLAVEATGDACFGLSVAEHMQPAALHGLGFSWLASDTLHDALKRLIRYQRVISTVARFALEDADDKVLLQVEVGHPGAAMEPSTIDTAMAVFVRLCCLAYGTSFNLCGVSMCRERPDCGERLETFFAAPIQYGAERNLLCFDRRMLSEPLPYANPQLARANDQVVIDYLKRFDRGSLTMRVRARLIELLPRGQPSQHEVAQSLHMSARNLQRKLHSEGTSFRKLLDETRRELAVQYIRETHRTIGEITFLLGFSEPSNFTRAFRRWTGISPHEFRRSN